MLPAFVNDARDQISLILQRSGQKGNEIAVQDGFDLYKEMVEIRRVHHDALPKYVYDDGSFSENRD